MLQLKYCDDGTDLMLYSEPFNVHKVCVRKIRVLPRIK